jgi:endonuclease G, mitochondrial
MDELLEKLRNRNTDIQRRDSVLSAELDEKRADLGPVDEVAQGSGLTGMDDEEGVDASAVLEEESIVMRAGRPVLAIVRDEAQLKIDDPESEVWKGRLQLARQQLVNAARAVGRIEVTGHSLGWLGTGWLVAPNVIVTNRHVAAEFGRQKGTSFVFRQGLSGSVMTASIDLLEEIDRADEWNFIIEQILHIEDADGPDVAFCRVAQSGGEAAPAPIRFSESAQADELVAVIGYPARDSRVPEQALMDKIFGNVYDKKRLAPGQLTGTTGDVLRHNCSTLGGNSGSVVLSLDTGDAVGLHYGGRFLESNFAVSAAVVGRRLQQVLSGTAIAPTVRAPQVVSAESGGATVASDATAHLTYFIPVRITVSIDGVGPQLTIFSSQSATPPAVSVETDEVFTEGVAADLADRTGYDESFLGPDLTVALPEVTDNSTDVLSFCANGVSGHVLRYEHFSVVMSRSRRLCRFSAVNIDGKTGEPLPRSGWKTDPRIPASAQVIKECYGNAPKFARGHMTRREDPIWGAGEAPARGNSDSMYVTNVVPQMQPFNAGVWLRLEQYALQHARQDQMKISVFTGPFLAADDPVMFGVTVPVEFWKVIAFIHDDTGKLCATGYTMSQKDFLSDQEFVFGRHKTVQTAIAAIEQQAGVSLGELSAHDPLDNAEAIALTELTDVRQIRFL